MNPTQAQTSIWYSDRTNTARLIRADGWDPLAGEGTAGLGSCSNGIDDDLDGLVDVADSDCTGLDLDGNGTIDLEIGTGGPVDLRNAVNGNCGGGGFQVLDPADDWAHMKLATWGPNSPGGELIFEEQTIHEYIQPRRADLRFSFVDDVIHAAIGAPVRIVGTVENWGPTIAQSSVITYQLPSGATASDLPPNCHSTADRVVCAQLPLRVGVNRTIEFDLELATNQDSGPMTLVASVSHDYLDRIPMNNTDRVTFYTSPRFASFEDLDDWTVAGGAALNSHATEGESSLQPQGCGYLTLTSTLFNTAEWEMVGEEFVVDVFVPADVPNPDWVGDLQMSIRSINSGVYGEYLGYQSLTQLPRGEWSPLTFRLTPVAFELIDHDNPAAEIEFALNTNLCGNNVLLDNLRMVTNKRVRTEFHSDPSGQGVESDSFMTFDFADDWSGMDQAYVVPTPTSEGTGALYVRSPGWTRVTSRRFATSEIGPTTSALSMDVMVHAPPSNPNWLGDVQAFLNCPSAGVYSAWLGYASLGTVFFDEFNAVEFPLPSNAVNTLDGDFNDCQISLQLSGNPMPEGFILDNMGFVD